MDYTLTEEQEQLKRLIEEFVARDVNPHWEKHGYEEFPWPLFRKLGELGLAAIPFPAEYGGGGLDYSTYAMALEELYSHYERPRTAILMGHARGVICLAAAAAKIPVLSYSATQVKRLLTGNGRAPKSQMQRAICHEFGLSAPPEPPDVADAMAIALCHHYLHRELSRAI